MFKPRWSGLYGAIQPRTASGEEFPEPPAGFAYLVNADGAFLVNADGAFILAKVA